MGAVGRCLSERCRSVLANGIVRRVRASTHRSRSGTVAMDDCDSVPGDGDQGRKVDSLFVRPEARRSEC